MVVARRSGKGVPVLHGTGARRALQGALLAVATSAGLLVAPATPASAVAGGREVGLHEIDPASALITVDGRWTCGGTIVARRLAITAAHCVTDAKTHKPLRSERIAVVARQEQFDWAAPLPGGTPVVKTVVSLDWNPGGAGADLALLRLAAPVPETEPAPVAEFRPSTGSRLRVIGWGPTSTEAAQTPDPSDDPGIARGANFKAVSSSSCTRHWIFRELWDGATMLCAGGASALRVCHGDSGSGAFHRGELVAVVSLSLPRACGDGGRHVRHAVFARPSRAFARTIQAMVETDAEDEQATDSADSEGPSTDRGSSRHPSTGGTSGSGTSTPTESLPGGRSIPPGTDGVIGTPAVPSVPGVPGTPGVSGPTASGCTVSQSSSNVVTINGSVGTSSSSVSCQTAANVTVPWPGK